MAIITVIPPAQNTVATRPVVWHLESNTANIVRMILVVTDLTNTVSTIEQNPEPGTTGVFKFNISSILADQLSFTTSNGLATGGINSTISQDSAFFNYSVVAWEVLADGTTNYPSSSDYLSGVFTAHNYILTHKEWVKPFLLSDYDMTTGTGKSFLTNSAATKCITKGYSEYLAMNNVQDNSFFVRDYYDANDVFLFSQKYPVVNSAAGIRFADQYGKIAGAGLPGSGTPASSAINYFDNLVVDAGTGKLVNGGNGFLYGAPGRLGAILRIDLTTNATTGFGTFPALVAPQYVTGVFSPVSGKIYFLPDSAGDIATLTIVGETITPIGGGLSPYFDQAITPSGVIYAHSSSVDNILKVDTATDIITVLNPGPTVGGSNGGIIYAQNGFIYTFNGETDKFYKLDPNTDILTSHAAVGWIAGSSGSSVVETSGGIIYVVSENANINNVMRIDTATDTATFLSTNTENTNLYRTAALLSDDNVYLFSYFNPEVLKLDTNTDTFSTFVSLVANPNHLYLTTVNGNQIYSAPTNPSTGNDQILDLTVTFADQIAAQSGAYCLAYIENSDLSIASEVKKYIFKDGCGEDIHIHWENKYGAQDSYTFKGRIVRGFNHDSENYLKPNGNVIASTTRGAATLSNTVEHIFEVHSKSIKKSEVNWIQEMFYNKRAWTEEDGHLLPIIIENGTVIESDSENGIYQVSFEFSYANLTHGSRG